MRWDRLRSRGRRWSRRGQEGAVLLETAILLTFFIVLSFGIVEYGLLYGRADDVATLVRSGARTGTATSSSPISDKAILQSIRSSSGDLGGEIQQVVIYKATVNGGQPPAECLNGVPIATKCNVYSQSDFGLTQSQLDASPHAAGWPSATRLPGVDYLGVYVKAQHGFLTKIFNKDKAYSDFAIMRLDAPASASSAASVGGGWGSGNTNYLGVNRSWTVPYTMPCQSNCGGGGSGSGGGSGGSF